MKHKLIPALMALFLVLTLSACGQNSGSGSTVIIPPISAPACVPAPVILAPDPAPQPTGDPLITAREMAIGSVVQCVDVSHGKALFLESQTREYTGPGSRNIRTLNLTTGTEEDLPIWADNGLARWNGGSYYWVAMDDQPVERVGQAFGPGMIENRWEDYVQLGIRRGDGAGKQELTYLLPRQPRDLKEISTTYSWNGEERSITALAAGENFLSWVEVWFTSDKDLGDIYVYELWAMDLKTGNVHRYLEGASDTPNQQKLWMNGDRVLFAVTPKPGLPSSPYLYDLGGGGSQLLDPPIIYDLQNIAFDDSQMAWGNRYYAFNKRNPDVFVPTATVYDLTTRESRDISVDREPDFSGDTETCEHIGGIGLFGGRYLLYSLWIGDENSGVRLYDLAADAVVYRSEEDSALSLGGVVHDSNTLVPEPGGSSAVLISGREGEQIIVTVFRVDAADNPDT